MYIPDNNDIFDYFESEQARRERIRHREEIEEKLEPDELLFYDPVTFIELGGRKPWKKKQL